MRILEVVGLSKRFGGRVALDAVSFTAEEGQILAVVGPRGAGKTTCGYCLSGVIPPDTGDVYVETIAQVIASAVVGTKRVVVSLPAAAVALAANEVATLGAVTPTITLL